MSAGFHTPVMVKETLEWLNCVRARVMVDCTVGMGGHALAILETIPADGLLLGLDRDPEALEKAREKLALPPPRVILKQADFRALEAVAENCDLKGKVDGMLFDLGVSSWQLDQARRGFSYQVDGPLDMRMNPDQQMTAAEIVNQWSESELTRVIRVYGEERWASRIARFIVESRSRYPLERTSEMVEIIKAAIPASARRQGGHPARRTFQALRIAVNEEVEALERGMDGALAVLAPGGRVVVISYHSLEDRVVKRCFRQGAGSENHSGHFQALTRRPVRPGSREQQNNPRSRSAKLRAAVKISPEGDQ